MNHTTTEPTGDGSPVWAPAPTATVADDRKERRREAKRQRDRERRPDSWERFRILLEVVDQQRSVVEIADHKARYALIILGVLNAVIFVLLGRGGVFHNMPDALKPWLVAVIALYAGLTFLFVLHAIDCLRPRELVDRGSVHRAGIPGLLFWEGIVQHDLTAYRNEWAEARMADLTDEAMVVAHRVSHLVKAKYRALHRLYSGLVVLIAICTLLLVTYAIWGAVP
jgi:Family of unknown function (DUF5706)